MAACSSIVAVTTDCGTEGRVAGLETCYMISYADLAPVSGDAGTPKYTVSSGGVVNAIGLADGKHFVEVQFYKNNGGLTQKFSINNQNGLSYWIPEFTLTLADLSMANRTFVNSVKNQPIVLIAKSMTGKFFFVGGNGRFQLSAAESGTGQADSDFYGYKLTWSGIELEPMTEVESTIISDLLA